ncbi:MAG: hypothetical protein WKF66_07885 [Pedobacter sp.]
MKKFIFTLLIIVGYVGAFKANAQNPLLNPLYEQGFKVGLEVGEYYRGRVLSDHPEYSMTYDIKFFQMNMLSPGGLDASTGTFNYTDGFIPVYFITSDPNNQIRNLYSDMTIIVQDDYLRNQFDADRTNMYNFGVWQGYNARMSGKVGGLVL